MNSWFNTLVFYYYGYYQLNTILIISELLQFKYYPQYFQNYYYNLNTIRSIFRIIIIITI